MIARCRLACVLLASIASGDAFTIGAAPPDSGVRVAAAESLVCAVREGRVYCWGSGLRNRPRGDTTAGGPRPVRVSGIDNAIDVTVGQSFACALLRDQSITCWGDNTVGQLGDGGREVTGGRAIVSGLRAVRHVSAGERHACAATADGRVWCWGANERGQLGDGTVQNRSVPVAVAEITDATRAAAGRFRSCAQLRNGRVACWGDSLRPDQSVVPPRIVDARELPAGHDLAMSKFDYACVIAGGAVHCMPDAAHRDKPGKLAGVNDAVSLSVGGSGGCAVRATGKVVCWDYSFTPEVVPGLDAAERTAQENGFGCAVRSGGAVACWGRADAGVLGDGTVGRIAEPVRVRGVDGRVSSIAVGASHACAIADERLLCWGSDRNRELGDGGTIDQPTAVPARLISDVRGAKLIAGFGYTCTLQTHTLRCWGQIANRLQGGEPPREIARDIAFVAPGGPPFCVVRTSGRVACAYQQMYGADFGAITDVPDLGTATAVAVEPQAVCALDAGGTVTCLGLPYTGPIFRKQLLVAQKAFRVTPATNVAEIALAEGRLFARTRAGATITVNLLEDKDPSTPSLATTYFGNDAIAIGAAERTTCAVREAGTVWCRFDEWDAEKPFREFALGASSIAVGRFHACAALRTGGAACWGATASGMLGDGTVGYRRNAVDVIFP